MRQAMRLALGSTFLLAAMTPLLAQQRMRMPDAKPTIQVSAESGVPEIPFEMINHHVILDVRVNGSGPFRAVLDTGMPAGGLVLYGGERVDALHLDYDSGVHAEVGGAGGEGKRLTAQIVSGQKVSMPGLELGNMRLTVLPPMPGFATYHDAIIGAALFRNFVVEIDHDAGVVRLHDIEKYTPPANASEAALTFRNGVPYTKATVRTLGGKTVPVNLVVDLGASHPVSLNSDSDEALQVPEGALETVIGRGISGDLEGFVGRIASLDLAGQRLENVVATFPVSGQQSPRGMDARNGNLGNGIMSRFNVAFDYSRERMLLVPDSHFHDPFEHDMSGLVLRESDGVVRIERVLPGSPAEEAGLHADDILVSLNGADVETVGLPEIQERLKKDGVQVKVRYRREDTEAETEMTLHRLV